jgi:Leucine-rich repeat (LRR) protein
MTENFSHKLVQSTSSEFSNDLGTVKIYGIGTNNPGFVALNESFEEYVAQFNEFKCREITFHNFSKNQRLDLSKITRPELVWRAQLKLLGNRSSIKLPDRPGEAFRNLVELKIDAPPKNFFSFQQLRELKVLDVTFDAKACDWKQHDGIIDLTLRGLKEKDLTQLSGMKALRRLVLVGGSIESLAGIESLANLEILHIVKTQQLLFLEDISKTNNLRCIVFEAYRKVKNMDFLSSVKSLTWLSVQELDSVQFLKDLPNLQFVICHKIVDKDDSPIKDHPGIQAATKEMQAARTEGKFPPQFLSPYQRLIDYDLIINREVAGLSTAPSSTTSTEPTGMQFVSDDGRVLMAAIERKGRRNPVFSSNGMGFNANSALIDENLCRCVSILYPTADIDLSKIVQPENILRLSVEGDGAPFHVASSMYERFTHLVDLVAEGAAAKSFLSIKRFLSLKRLRVTHDGHPDWMDHAGLVDLDVSGLSAKNLHCLSGMKSLKRLSISGSKIESLEGIECLPNLESLLINDVKKLVSFDALFQCQNLQHLSVGKYRKNMDWQFLAALKNLQSLRLYEAQSIHFISDMPSLEVIVCDKLIDKNRSPITNHPKIQWREAADEQSRKTNGENLPCPLWDRQLPEVATLLGVDLADLPLPS